MKSCPDDQTNVAPVRPVLRPCVRLLCCLPYPGHPRGCPNWGARATCPPQARLFEEQFDPEQTVYCIWNEFDLRRHMERMRKNHPKWSARQLRCCLYWQGKARKQLRSAVQAFLAEHTKHVPLYCPEANGVDVSATLVQVGVELQWPPRDVTYQVALAAVPRQAASFRPPHLDRSKRTCYSTSAGPSG